MQLKELKPFYHEREAQSENSRTYRYQRKKTIGKLI
tara:strand:- start:953 stop:1060 length:108 start_codon:yes stop_codon:yes gene_type:complete